MKRIAPFPLDLSSVDYAYLERPNVALIQLLESRVLRRKPTARLLDVGCGAGANARAIKQAHPGVHITGIEPNARAAGLAEQACDSVFCGTTETWTAGADSEPFDALILSDVLEHTADPLGFLTKLTALPSVRSAVWIVSVPNYAVWYNRVRTLLGRFEYSWSGLYDRTHLRFFTRSSVQRVLEHCGFEVLEDICSPSLAQSAAPVLRRLFSNKLESGDHLALTDSASYGFYSRWIEPLESATCRLWPELLGFQIITAARLRA